MRKTFIFLMVTGMIGLMGCSSSQQVATPPPPQTPPMPAFTVDGVWDYTMSGEGATMTGVMTIDSEAKTGNLTVREQGIDAPLSISVLEMEGADFTLIATVDSPMGMVEFTFNGTVDGNDMRGNLFVDGIGNFDIAGTRQ